MTAHLNVGVVGLGYWGKNLLRTFGALPRARVTGLCDVDPARIAAFAPEHPGACGSTDFAAFVQRDDVEAVVLATPPSRHHAMARAALEAGKHVWVEKPLALTAADGRDLVETAARHGRTLFVDETFLYDPLVREMKRIVDQGGLGDVYHLSFERLGMGRIKRDSNVWWNSAPHDVSILLHLVPRQVLHARLHEHAYLQPGIADVVVCDLELEGGVSAHVYLSWLHPEKTAKVIVVGRERMLAYEGRFEKRGLTLYDYELDMAAPAGDTAGIVPITRFAGQRLEIPAAAEPLALAAEHFADSILTGTEPLTSGARSLRVVEVLEAAEHAATRGGRAG
ncbi:MAG TPA: Gfo/Idh/MocA family oxidoreductase [Gaiellaceae bacterium]|nr:Gfo/Idh/MocA family oxidoreductase [Gaiellaceae bacterium]